MASARNVPWGHCETAGFAPSVIGQSDYRLPAGDVCSWPNRGLATGRDRDRPAPPGRAMNSKWVAILMRQDEEGEFPWNGCQDAVVDNPRLRMDEGA